MKKIERKDLWMLLAQAAVWLIMMMMLPLATFISTRNWESTSTSLTIW